MVCFFGEKETGVEGSKFVLLAPNGSATVYAAVESDNTDIEFNQLGAADPALRE